MVFSRFILQYVLLLCQQEKLSKSIGYLISKEDQVKTQIFQLEHMIDQTEVGMAVIRSL